MRSNNESGIYKSWFYFKKISLLLNLNNNNSCYGLNWNSNLELALTAIEIEIMYTDFLVKLSTVNSPREMVVRLIVLTACRPILLKHDFDCEVSLYIHKNSENFRLKLNMFKSLNETFLFLFHDCNFRETM